MRLFQEELKRVIKLQSTIIIITIALALSVLMAIIPIMFVSADVETDTGSVKELNGINAIKYWKTIHTPSNGEVTIEKLKNALETYQECVARYGDPQSDSFPEEIRVARIAPITPLIMLVSEAYSKGYDRNSAESNRCRLEDIPIDDIDSFYEVCTNGVLNVGLSEGASEITIRKADTLYKKIKTPFVINCGFAHDAPLYFSLSIFILVMMSAIIGSQIFASDYESSSDHIIRCTKHGRELLATARMSAITVVCVFTYMVAIMLNLTIMNMSFGIETLRSSVQTLGNISVLLDMTILDLEKILVLGGLLSLVSTNMMSYYISSKCEKASASLVVSMIMVITPTILFAVVGNTWIGSMLPTSGVALTDADLLSQLTKYRFLEVGEMSFWNPQVTMFFAILWVPVLGTLAKKGYCKHQIK